MGNPRGYTTTVSASDAAPALVAGGPEDQTMGSAFTVILCGDLTTFRTREAGSELDLAEETKGQLVGRARFPTPIPKTGDIQLSGADVQVKDRAGRRLVDGTILVDETGNLNGVEKCQWR